MTTDYELWWRSKSSIAGFGERLLVEWAYAYLSSTDTDPSDLVRVDPGNQFTYLFDLAGSLDEEPRSMRPGSSGYGVFPSPETTVETEEGCGGFPDRAGMETIVAI